MPLAFWVHHLDRFLGPHWGNFGIRYYGLSYVMGFIAGAALLTLYAKRGRSALPANRVADLMAAIVIGTLVGGRLGYYLLYHFADLEADPLILVRVWEGGMASHGGMLGVTIALYVFSRSEKIPFLHLGDLIVSVAPAGLFFGRIANFINGELWGKPSRVPWAVIFPDSAPPGTPIAQILPRHPSQLYEAGLEGLLLLAYLQLRFWKSDIVREKPGQLSGEFFIAYAVVRIIGETFREPDAGLILGLSRGTFYSLAFLVGPGLVLIAHAQWRRSKR
jgi:phosphatidylglycerol:prolipoprotein diacylglycerol transferase